LFKQLTGLPCPGCGLTRAYQAAWKGNYAEAFSWHPLFWLVPVAGAAAVAWQAQPLPRRGDRTVGRLAGAALTAWLGLWLARLTVGLPGVASRRW
jgi:hypothetical protein